MLERDRRSELENDLRLARDRYKVATERFERLFGSIPSLLPQPDGCKQIELVTRERRLAMQQVAEAMRKWTDFLLDQSRIHVVRTFDDPNAR